MPEVHQVLEQGVHALRQQIICFNMGSIIIKPVQRILKYPLILNELIKCTEIDHPDKNRLMVAAALMTSVATYINESKRKKEIVLKYRDSCLESDKIIKKMTRLNKHTLTKHAGRLGMKIKTTIGIVTPTTVRDEFFEEVEHKFIELVRVTKTALTDITEVCEQLKSTSQTQFNISEAVANFYGEGSRVPLIDNFRTAQRMIFSQHWQSFVSAHLLFLFSRSRFDSFTSLLLPSFSGLLRHPACSQPSHCLVRSLQWSRKARPEEEGQVDRLQHR